MFWLAYFPIQEAPNIRQKLFGAALGRNRRENVAKHNSNKHNEIYHLGAEIGTRSDFFLQLVIHQKRSLSTFMMLKRNSAILLQHSLPRVALFLQYGFCPSQCPPYLKVPCILLAWSKALFSSQNLLFWIVESPGWYLVVQQKAMS